MESFEFLGGRYNRPEQIMSGPVQAFKAQNAANGRTVFIHRVSTTEAPAEQSALLKLLTTALVKSADAKRLVLDFGEESGYWYVVTESEPQCALLREWLQLEIDAAVAGSKPVAKVAPPASTAPTQKADPGEFTRFIQRPSLSSAGTATRLGQKPSSPATPPLPVTSPPPAGPPAEPMQVPPVPPERLPPTTPAAVGEFTRLFQSGPAKPPADLASAPPGSTPRPTAPPASVEAEEPPMLFFNRSELPPGPPSPPPQQAPGEFTSFFNAGDGERKSKPVTPPPAMHFPGSSAPQGSSPGVSPEVSNPPDKKQEPGEFTRFFAPGLPSAPPKQSIVPPAGMNFERTQRNPFVQRPNSPPPPPSPNEPGEFTRMFSNPDKTPAGPSRMPDSYPPPANRSDPMGFAKQPSSQSSDFSDSLFNDKIEMGKPLASSQPPQSEFTKVFGAVGSEAPPIKPPAVVAAQREQSLLDEGHATRHLPVRPTQPPNEPMPPGGPSSAEGPSEFTMIMQGGYGQKPAGGPGGGAPGGAGGAGGGAPAGKSGLPIDVNVAPIGSMLPHLGSVGGSVAGMHGNISQHGASAGSALGSAHVGAPPIPGAKLGMPPANLNIPGPDKAAANKKLMLFFVILGVLALLLVVVVLFLIKSKS